jgi:predicted RNA-binding protein with PUA-like domain
MDHAQRVHMQRAFVVESRQGWRLNPFLKKYFSSANPELAYCNMQYWLVKQEPTDYGWNEFVKEGQTAWTGVRNFQARNNLRGMKKGDCVLFYHSGEEKSVVGLAKVHKEAYADPTADEGDWSAVDLTAERPLEKPVSLQQIKANRALKDMVLVKNSRLSVMPVTKEQFKTILELAG